MKSIQRKAKVADESDTARHAAGHTRSHAASMKQQNAEKSGSTYPHKDSCPARNKKCTSCGKLNHFAKVCRTVPPDSVKRVTEEEGTDDDDYVYARGEKKQPMCRLEIDGEYLEMMLDSGASVNLIDEVTYKRIYKGKAKTLEQAKRRIFSYGSPTPLALLGTIQAEITAKSSSTSATLHVVKGSSGNLLGYDIAQRLGLQKIVNQVGTDKTSPQYLTSREFENLFGGIGRVKGKVVKPHIDPDVQPRQQPHPRIPFHVWQDVEKELERLKNLDIIEKVTGSTPWVSPIVVVLKSSGQVRLCMDMREANKAVTRERHLMPTIDDLVADLNGATVFSKLDLSSRYHQLKVKPESCHITTFSTHVGLRRYKRLMFGINAASEIFQNAIEEILTGLPGCKNISDDIIVFVFKSLLGMAQYVSRYVAEYATITAPLRALTKKETPWQWSTEQQHAFDKLKDSLTKSHVMSYFNPAQETKVIVDASPVCLGGILAQDGKIISYASRALSNVESRYSQTERELLAIVWALEHFHLYLYGTEITTDHKPLLGIFNTRKPTSARIDRWKPRLMPYNCHLVHRP